MAGRMQDPNAQVRIYGKHESQKTFRAMNLKTGEQATCLIFATILSWPEALRFIKTESEGNPDWSFQVRPIPRKTKL